MKQCCFCFSLRTGTVITGILSLILSTVGIGYILPQLAYVRTYSHDSSVSGSSDSQWRIVSTSSTIETDITEPFKMAVESLYLIFLTCSVVTGLASFLMIFGATRKVSRFIFPWLALNFATIVNIAFGIVAIVIAAILNGRPIFQFTYVAFTAVGITLNFFIWLAVFSYYEQLVRKEAQHYVNPNRGKIISPPPIYTHHQ